MSAVGGGATRRHSKPCHDGRLVRQDTAAGTGVTCARRRTASGGERSPWHGTPAANCARTIRAVRMTGAAVDAGVAA
ncbi:hypothetical protein NRB56_69330 [Nocardia sp. RB56]|uniref:Uncharacterized protein n=1 Tax=Nocardia aurantia TaxID=2585199 RepID=A0A7K0E2E7_9NOCA|nr:hypothetical protein [Nocardia aurantia]